MKFGLSSNSNAISAVDGIAGASHGRFTYPSLRCLDEKVMKMLCVLWKWRNLRAVCHGIWHRQQTARFCSAAIQSPKKGVEKKTKLLYRSNTGCVVCYFDTLQHACIGFRHAFDVGRAVGCKRQIYGRNLERKDGFHCIAVLVNHQKIRKIYSLSQQSGWLTHFS